MVIGVQEGARRIHICDAAPGESLRYERVPADGTLQRIGYRRLWVLPPRPPILGMYLWICHNRSLL